MPHFSTSPRVLRYAVLACAAAAALPAQALTDALNDFLPTYTGPHAADLDVVASDVVYDPLAATYTFSATLAGAVGATSGASYIWGLDRGQGTERFVTGTPSVGAGVKFDSVLILRPNGTGQFNDLINNTQVALPQGSVHITGSVIATDGLAAALFPSLGLAADQFTWNLWPRSGGGNAAISDFAPDASNAPLHISAVPEPQAAAMLAAGLMVLAGLQARGRRRNAADTGQEPG